MKMQLGTGKWLVLAAVAAGLFTLAVAGAASAFGASTAGGKKMERSLAFPKAGLGLVRNRLYIVVESTRNELIFPDGRRWRGAGWQVPQLIVVWRNEVVSMQALPKDFVLQDSVIISYHPTHVDFIDPEAGALYYYNRDTKAPVPSDGKVVNPYE